MSAQPRTPETVPSADVLDGVHPDVIDFCGPENVELVESLSAEMLAWQELAQAPNPFRTVLTSSPESEGITLTEPSSQANIDQMEEASSISIRRPASQKAMKIAREQAPILTGFVVEGHKSLSKAEALLATRLAKTQSEIREQTQADIKTVDVEDVARLLDELTDTAPCFPNKGSLRQLRELVGAEADARIIDATATGARKKPKLAVRYMQAFEDKSALIAKTTTKEWSDLGEALRDAGYKSWRVKRTHRNAITVLKDDQYIKKAPERLGRLKTQGTELYADLIVLASEAIVTPANELFARLNRIKEANSEVLREAQSGSQDSAEIDACRQRAIKVEGYLAEHARAIPVALQRAGFKATLKSRRDMRALAEEPLKRDYERDLRAKARNAGKSSLSQEVAPDTEFRKDCAVAKKVVDGGAHLDDPRATKLAKDIHDVNLGAKAGVEFGRPEQGIIVAIITNDLPSLLAAMERVQAADAEGDIQVRMLRQAAPRQATAIGGFNLRASVGTLKQIFDDTRRRNDLVNPLNNNGFKSSSREVIERVCATIDVLHQQLESSASAAS